MKKKFLKTIGLALVIVFYSCSSTEENTDTEVITEETMTEEEVVEVESVTEEVEQGTTEMVEEVETLMLDEFLPFIENLKLIKIDVESAEFDVLSGAEGLIHKHQPYIIIEAYQ